MTHNTVSKVFTAFTLVLGLSLTACRKDRDFQLPDFDPYAAQMNAQQAITLLQDLTYEATTLTADLYDGDGTVSVGQCPTFTLTQLDSSGAKYPAKLIIDAGTGCLWRGHSISGSVVLILDKAPSDGNAHLSGTVTQLVLDQTKMNGQLDITLGAAQKPFANMAAILTDFTIVTPESDELSIETMTAQRLQTQGALTVVSTGGKAALDDDVFEVSVTGNGKTATNLNFDVITETPVTRKMDCRWIALGKIVVEVGPTDGYVDFGDGNCDNQVLLKIGSEEKSITLR